MQDYHWLLAVICHEFGRAADEEGSDGSLSVLGHHLDTATQRSAELTEEAGLWHACFTDGSRRLICLSTKVCAECCSTLVRIEGRMQSYNKLQKF